MHHSFARAAAAVTAALLLIPAAPFTANAADSTVHALVASNAKGAFTEIIKQFEAKHKGVKIDAQYLGGKTIGTKIDTQEDIDFVLVGQSILDKETQLIDTPTPVLRNKDVLLVPKGNPGKITSLKDLAGPGAKIAIGTPGSAVGNISAQVIQKAAGDYGFDFVQAIRKNLAVQEEKGSDVVAALDSGKANVAFAFASDVNPSKYDTIQIDEKYNVVSVYSVTVPKNAKNAALGKELAALVAGPEGQATLHKFNYMSPPGK